MYADIAAILATDSHAKATRHFATGRVHNKRHHGHVRLLSW